MNKKEIIPIILILAMAGAGIALYPRLPEQAPSHWNAAGEIDGYAGKNFTVFFYPLISLVVYLLLVFLPKIDPFRKNYQKFALPYYFIRLAIIILFAGLYLYTLFAALNISGLGTESGGLPINWFIIPLVSLMIIAFGIAMPKIKKNFFVGIRTPWTLQSDEVWDKTHQLGGKVFITAGLLSMLGVFFGKNGFWIFMILVIGGSVIPLVYSYVLYRRLGLFEKKNVL